MHKTVVAGDRDMAVRLDNDRCEHEVPAIGFGHGDRGLGVRLVEHDGLVVSREGDSRIIVRGRKSRDSARQQDNGQQSAQKTLQVFLHGSLSSFFIDLGGIILSHRREDCKGTRRAPAFLDTLGGFGVIYYNVIL